MVENLQVGADVINFAKRIAPAFNIWLRPS